MTSVSGCMVTDSSRSLIIHFTNYMSRRLRCEFTLSGFDDPVTWELVLQRELVIKGEDVKELSL